MLQDNFFVNNLVSMVALHQDSESSGLECDNCNSDDPPVYRCHTCSHFLCEFCTQAHRRGRTTSFHDLMSLDEAKTMGSIAVSKPLICKEHEGEVMKLFCETCEEVICRDCTIVKHRDHRYTFVKDVFCKGKESLLNTLSETETKLSSLKEALDGIKEMKCSVHKCAEQTMQEVSDCFNEMMTTLDARRGELVASVEELEKAKLKSLEIQQEELEIAFGSVQSSVEFTKRALESGSEVEILNLRKQMSRRLQDLNSSKWQLQPSVDYGLKFKSDNLLKLELANFGVVTDKVACGAMSILTMGNGQEGVMYNTRCGQSVEFTITAKERSGKKWLDGGDNVLAAVCPKDAKDPATCTEFLEVNDCGNGTYCFSYTPVEEDYFELSVELNGCPVQGSPFTWYVLKWNLEVPSSPNREGLLHLSDDGLTAENTGIQSVQQIIPMRGRSSVSEFLPHSVVDSFGNRSEWDSGPQVANTIWVGSTLPEQIHSWATGGCGNMGHPGINVRPFVECSLVLDSGRYMWKARVFGNILQGFSFGLCSSVSGETQGQSRKWWVWNSRRVYQFVNHFQTAVKTSTIIDCVSGDIIEMYLDCEEGTLKMYNPRTKQSDALSGIESGVLPVFCMTSRGQKVSLKM